MGTALEPDKYTLINFEETELRLGLPGSDSDGFKSGKRGFLQTVDLMLNLSSTESAMETVKEKLEEDNALPAKPPAKAQVVGWPPIRSFRKNVMAVQKTSFNEENEPPVTTVATATSGSGGGAAFVKVSVDGAPYLRKVDLKLYKTYAEFSAALGKMLSSFPIAAGNPAIDLSNGSDYVPTYEDKDGDWMLVGDVPWEMFVDSCKRLRIMKGADAIGLGSAEKRGKAREQKLRSSCVYNQALGVKK